ncbi:MAG: hypothetical protein HFI48_15980 [Lachnospiraceae bacterium]|nr:hypothetical protein [Lachnospiraceae bacterium]
MASYTEYKHLEKPLSTEKYNVGVFNKNNDIIDTELHKLELKNADQDTLFASKEDLNQHTGNQENPHSVSKAQIGLDNVDNTADLDKPVSTAQRAAINNIYIQTSSYVDTKIANLIDGAPETLDTLKELANALEENATIVDALNESIENKVNKTELNKYLPLTGGIISKGSNYLLSLKNIAANGSSALALFPGNGLKGHILVQSNFRENGNQFIVVRVDENNKNINLLVISENTRTIYDYKTKSVKEIMVRGDEASSCENDFILINQQPLSFTNNTCIIPNNRITVNSLADVYFTSDTIETAENADITVETFDGSVKLTAKNLPTGEIKATIRIRVV